MKTGFMWLKIRNGISIGALVNQITNHLCSLNIEEYLKTLKEVLAFQEEFCSIRTARWHLFF